MKGWFCQVHPSIQTPQWPLRQQRGSLDVCRRQALSYSSHAKQEHSLSTAEPNMTNTCPHVGSRFKNGGHNTRSINIPHKI